MRKDLFDYLCCPECRGELDLSVDNEDDYGIESGKLSCTKCDGVYPVINHIPRFVPADNYAAGFGYEWEKFGKVRFDSYNKTKIIHNTILRRTKWDEEFFKGKLLLECGCGAGNDTEALLDFGATVIALDYSCSVDVSWEWNRDNENFLPIQADIFNIPVKEEAFDIVYCHRVIQHTPDPERGFYSIAKHVKPGGSVFLHSYSTRLKSMLHYKYAVRPFIRRIPHEKILDFLEQYGPFLYKMLGLAIRYRLKFFRKIIPFENNKLFLEKAGAQLTEREMFEYDLLNTFDALTPAYDIPKSASTVLKWFENAGLTDIQLNRKKPVMVVGKRA